MIERIILLITHLKETREILSQSEFAEKIGVKPSQISEMLSGKRVISERTVHKITQYFTNINREWLLTGEGEMLKNNQQLVKTENGLKSSLAEKVDEGKLIPVYDTILSTSPRGYIYVYDLPRCDGAVRANSEAMSPYIQPGDMVLFKEQKNLRDICYGSIYLIAFNLGDDPFFAIKYLRESESDGYVTLANYNPAFKPQDIPIDSINALAIVRASIKYMSIF